MRTRAFPVAVLVLASGLLLSAASNDCTFLINPDDYVVSAERRHKSLSDLSSNLQMHTFASSNAESTVSPSEMPRNNFIDDHIFGRMEKDGIKSAPLSNDYEFLRRVTLDMTGRIPTRGEIEYFVADTNPSKRDLKVSELLFSPEFTDKWTMFFGDLYKVNANATNINREIPGRDAFYLYLKESIASNKPYDLMARELIAATGDSFELGPPNFAAGNNVAMGPAQDTYDGHAVNVAAMFMGINAVDCLLCHDGARHLDTVNLWGAKQTRLNMWGLSAYFARYRRQQVQVSVTPQSFKQIITEAATGEYTLNTTTGNRSARQPTGGVTNVAPRNPFATAAGTGIATGENRRQAIARQLTSDIQFSRAIVNYIWEELMVEGFVSPSNSFDLARLDPKNPPPAPWTLQPTNPELLDALAHWFPAMGYDVRALVALIVKSNAYQLSSVYPGEWSVNYVPYYARKYVRRLDAEEIHDAVAKATGLLPTYTLTGSVLPPVQWAMQFPDTREPRSNGGVATFLNTFGRGDRDTSFRRGDGSMLQSLNMMNNTFITGRIHQANVGSRVQILLSRNSSPDTIINDLYLNTLSRPPSNEELALFRNVFQVQGNRVAAENLQWTLMNKLDFIFNY